MYLNFFLYTCQNHQQSCWQKLGTFLETKVLLKIIGIKIFAPRLINITWRKKFKIWLIFGTEWNMILKIKILQPLMALLKILIRRNMKKS